MTSNKMQSLQNKIQKSSNLIQTLQLKIQTEYSPDEYNKIKHLLQKDNYWQLGAYALLLKTVNTHIETCKHEQRSVVASGTTTGKNTAHIAAQLETARNRLISNSDIRDLIKNVFGITKIIPKYDPLKPKKIISHEDKKKWSVFSLSVKSFIHTQIQIIDFTQELENDIQELNKLQNIKNSENRNTATTTNHGEPSSFRDDPDQEHESDHIHQQASIQFVRPVFNEDEW